MSVAVGNSGECLGKCMLNAFIGREGGGTHWPSVERFSGFFRPVASDWLCPIRSLSSTAPRVN